MEGEKVDRYRNCCASPVVAARDDVPWDGFKSRAALYSK